MNIAITAASAGRTGTRGDKAVGQGLPALVAKFGGEFRAMPGLRLTPGQAGRLFGVQAEVATLVLDELARATVLARGSDGRYALASSGADRSHRLVKSVPIARLTLAPAPDGKSKDASLELLSCLMRHWSWTDEARLRLEHSRTDDWEYESVGGDGRSPRRLMMAEHLTDDDVLSSIGSLVDEEHRLYGQPVLTDRDRVRLQRTKVTLDRYWDLLRQRRALREFDGDPDRATMRSASTVEQYEQ